LPDRSFSAVGGEIILGRACSSLPSFVAQRGKVKWQLIVIKLNFMRAATDFLTPSLSALS
jgi:hypothetical protein